MNLTHQKTTNTMRFLESTNELFKQITEMPDDQAQLQLLETCDSSRLEPLMDLLTHELDAERYRDTQRILGYANLLLNVAELTNNPLRYALGLHAKGDVYLFGLHEYAVALKHYTKSAQVYIDQCSAPEAAVVIARRICVLALQEHRHAATREFDRHRDLLERYQVLMPLAQELKEHVDRQRHRADGISNAYDFAEQILLLADLSPDEPIHALGLRAKGNIYLSLQDYKQALSCYTNAAEIYRWHRLELEAAESEVGTVSVLAHLGRYVEAEAKCEEISKVFKHFKHWDSLIKTLGNLTIIYQRLGNDIRALSTADQAKDLCQRLEDEGVSLIPLLENNRAISLRNLGRFAESMQASQISWNSNMQLGQTAEAARALQTMAFTYFLQGHYNKSMQLYEQAKSTFVAGKRLRDALAGEIEATDCLLQLRRFEDVLEKCAEIQSVFSTSTVQDILIRAYINQATAYASKNLPEYDRAMGSLREARELLEATAQNNWVTDVDLAAATILTLQGSHEESLAIAQRCASEFHQRSLIINAAFAWLIAARSALMLEQYSTAYRFVLDAARIAQSQAGKAVPFLAYQVHNILGTLALVEGDYLHAQIEFEQAIDLLERLRGQVMIEFTFGFLEDKQSAYEQIVTLYLDKLNDSTKAWHFAERAKSRALLDLITNHIDLSIRSRNPDDDALVEELTALRAEHSRLYRRQQEERRQTISEGKADRRSGHATQIEEAILTAEQEIEEAILTAEQEIEKQWNTLLMRNVDYTLDHTVALVSLERIQAHLDENSCIIEYFVALENLSVFIITANAVKSLSLGPLADLHPLFTFLRMNLDAVPRSSRVHIGKLINGIQGILCQLYSSIIAPIEQAINEVDRLIVIPHGPLHALPFHALYDGEHYLVERYEFSYLPSASLLPICNQIEPTSTNALILAHTQGGELTGRRHEGQAVNELLNGTFYLDDAATLARFHEHAGHCRVLHLATHGQFNMDNPLFSGLALEDGELTTYDIFNLRLSASLVVLSACETAKARVGGGDELIGLSRALMYAGAKSLIISHWKVEDESTKRLMCRFYNNLMQGCTKGMSLQETQRYMIRQEEEPMFQHPYFWSAFFLMGDTGIL